MKKSLPLVVGNAGLDKQLRELDSVVHVCGHLHINFETTIENVKYVQNALAHPYERKQWWKIMSGSYAPKLVFSTPIN